MSYIVVYTTQPHTNANSILLARTVRTYIIRRIFLFSEKTQQQQPSNRDNNKHE